MFKKSNRAVTVHALRPKKRTRAVIGSRTVLQICTLLAKVTTECGSATSVYNSLFILERSHFNLAVICIRIQLLPGFFKVRCVSWL